MNDTFFKKLPTEIIIFDLDFNRIQLPKNELEKAYDSYYLATCHYVDGKNERQYYTAKNQIKLLVQMNKDEDEDYPHFVKNVWAYGEKIK